MPLFNEFSFIASADRKYILRKYLSLDEVLEKGPCAEALVYFIKATPKELLMLEIDPDNDDHCKRFKQFMTFLTKDDKWYDVIEFLEDNHFIEWDDLTDEEYNRYYRNLRRREQRAKLKGKKKKK